MRADSTLLGPKSLFVIDLVYFATAVARLVCPDLLGKCLSHFANHFFGPCTAEFATDWTKKRALKVPLNTA